MKHLPKIVMFIATLPLLACSGGHDEPANNTSPLPAIASETASTPLSASTAHIASASASDSTANAASHPADAVHSPTNPASEIPATFDATFDAVSEAAVAPHHGNGMHPICEQYFHAAQSCFARAPEAHRARLLASLQESRAELMGADGETCTVVNQQFDEWMQSVNCQ